MAHGEPAQILVHVARRARAAARDIDLGHVDVVVGAVGGHGLDEGEQRLARRLEVALHLGECARVVELVALDRRLRALIRGIEHLVKADRLEEFADRQVDAQHRVHGDVAIAAAGECLRQRLAHLAGHDRLGELLQAAQGARREPGEHGELGEPGGAAVGLDAQLVHLAVEGLKQRIDCLVVAQRREVVRRDDRLLMDQDDVRGL